MGYISYATRRHVIGALIVVLVVALFFLPEIIDLTPAGGEKDIPSEEMAVLDLEDIEVLESEEEFDSASSAAEIEKQQIVKEQQIDLESLSPLERVQYSLQQEQKQEKLDKIEEIPVPEGEPSYSCRVAGDAEEAMRSYTWKEIRSKQSRRALLSAKNLIIDFYKQLGVKNETVKCALGDLIDGIAYLQDGADQKMTADEAVEYLYELYIRATREVAHPSMLRAQYLRWKDIKFGPVLESPVLDKAREQYQPAFDPKLKLYDVQVHHPQVVAQQNSDNKAPLLARAFVIGAEARKVEVRKNGRLISKQDLPGATGRNGERIFTFWDTDARGRYTLTVYDAEGSSFTKHYSFYPKISVFGWGKQGDSKVPFAEGSRDPRMDSFFLVKADKKRSNKGFFGNSQLVTF